MANNNIFNVNSELSIMKNYIADIDHCTSKVKEVNDSALLYQTNYKINVLTIAATVYALACAIFQLNVVLIGIGAVLACIMVMLRKHDQSNRYKVSCILNIAIIACSIIFFMILFTIIPILVVLVEWVYTIVCNFKLKNQIWQISSSL